MIKRCLTNVSSSTNEHLVSKMSTKKKSVRSEWVGCQTCDILVSSKDWTKHKTQCAGNRGTAIRRSPPPTTAVVSPGCTVVGVGAGQAVVSDNVLSHGYIRSGVLHSEVCLQAEKGLFSSKFGKNVEPNRHLCIIMTKTRLSM